MKAQKNKVTLISPPPGGNDPTMAYKEVKATVISDAPITQIEKTHSQMSIGAMISYEKQQIAAIDKRIEEMKKKKQWRQGKIKALVRVQKLQDAQ